MTQRWSSTTGGWFMGAGYWKLVGFDRKCLITDADKIPLLTPSGIFVLFATPFVLQQAFNQSNIIQILCFSHATSTLWAVIWWKTKCGKIQCCERFSGVKREKRKKYISARAHYQFVTASILYPQYQTFTCNIFETIGPILTHWCLFGSSFGKHCTLHIPNNWNLNIRSWFVTIFHDHGMWFLLSFIGNKPQPPFLLIHINTKTILKWTENCYSTIVPKLSFVLINVK